MSSRARRVNAELAEATSFYRFSMTSGFSWMAYRRERSALSWVFHFLFVIYLATQGDRFYVENYVYCGAI